MEDAAAALRALGSEAALERVRRILAERERHARMRAEWRTWAERVERAPSELKANLEVRAWLVAEARAHAAHHQVALEADPDDAPAFHTAVSAALGARDRRGDELRSSLLRIDFLLTCTREQLTEGPALREAAELAAKDALVDLLHELEAAMLYLRRVRDGSPR